MSWSDLAYVVIGMFAGSFLTSITMSVITVANAYRTRSGYQPQGKRLDPVQVFAPHQPASGVCHPHIQPK